MSPQETPHIPVKVYVALVLIVAIVGCFGTVFSGSGLSFLQRSVDNALEPASESMNTSKSDSDQEEIAPPDNSSNSVGRCPSTSEEAANLFGGSATHWKRLAGNEQYAWKYGPAPAAPIANFNVPEGMKGDWWDNFNTHSQIGPVRGGYATEATIWCSP